MRVLITGGGTGGHVMPGLAVAEALQTLDPAVEILFAGTRRGIEAELVPNAGYDFATVPASGVRGLGWGARFRFLCNLIVGLLRSLVLVIRWRPDVVLSTGGYVGVPVMLAARLLRKPLAVQEQNSVPGSANRLMARWARRIDLGFATAASYFPGRDTTHTGNPVRSALVKALKQNGPWSWDETRPMRVLIFGGSRGAASLNRAMVAAAPDWAHRLDLEFHLQTGREDHARVASAYAAEAAAEHVGGVRIQPFIEDMPKALCWADLVICRAGAMTLAELAVAGRPSILVPFPHATDDHQTTNAGDFVAAGASVLLPDARCDGPALQTLVDELKDAPERLDEMARASRGLARPEAALDVAVGLMRLAGALPDTRPGS